MIAAYSSALSSIRDITAHIRSGLRKQYPNYRFSVAASLYKTSYDITVLHVEYPHILTDKTRIGTYLTAADDSDSIYNVKRGVFKKNNIDNILCEEIGQKIASGWRVWSCITEKDTWLEPEVYGILMEFRVFSQAKILGCRIFRAAALSGIVHVSRQELTRSSLLQ